MPKAEKGTPKYLANKMKAKGLQKLRWYCQMCEKQCRDENGFKCHTTSESHQRQLLLFAESEDKFLDQFSKDFEDGYLYLLKRCHGTKRVFANAIYQDYIHERDHIHMNSTKWLTLTEFVQHLGKSGKCVVDQTEKGWYVTWVDRDPETIARQEALQKKEKMAKDDSERMEEFINRQVGRGSLNDNNEKPEYTELHRPKDEKIALNLEVKTDSAKRVSVTTKNVLSHNSKSLSVKEETKKGTEKRKKSALEEIMEEEKLRKRAKEINRDNADNVSNYSSNKRWLRKGIVVKIITKSLGDKYYKQKGYVKEVVGEDKMAAIVVLTSSGTKIKLDQSHLETVIPAVGRTVLILSGPFIGKEAVLKDLDVDNFCARLKITETGEKLSFQYEEFSKLYES
jgi:DNA/RNA-binding protein KIN17